MGDAPTPGPDLTALNASFRRTLRAQNKSDRTVEAYTDAVRLLADFCAADGHPLTVSALKRKHIELFIADQLAHWKPATANNRYRGLQSFFTWALAGGELEASPMAGMRPPQIPEIPVPVLTEDQLRRLLKACDGRDFAARRDSAIIRLLIDTGLRRGECAGILLDDLDLDDQVVTFPLNGVAGSRWSSAAGLGCTRRPRRRSTPSPQHACGRGSGRPTRP
jgi:integrase